MRQKKMTKYEERIFELLGVDKDLKAIEILKQKRVDTNHLWSLIKRNDDETALAEYNKYNRDQYELTETEFKLLKEIL